MTEINYGISASMQNCLTVYGENRLQSNDKESENSGKEQLDSVVISDEAVRQQNENMSLDKKLEVLVQHFMEQFTNPKSLEMYRVENPFKMELRASSVFGGENLFQDYSECQYEVFNRWMKENVKNTIVPQSLRSDFGQLINEYVRFNEESRNSIMERMTPNYMYEDIGKSSQFLRNKGELLSSQRNFYEQEKEDVRDLLREYYSETSNKDRVKTKLQQYIERYQKKNNSMYSDSGLFDKGLVYLMVR